MNQQQTAQARQRIESMKRQFEQKRAIASSLVERGLKDARKAGHGIVTAVGELGLFGRFGFVAATPLGLVMPGLADANRLLVLGGLDGIAGCLGSDGS